MKKCDQCRKKVGLLGFECKCGKTLCATHRYPEAHGCDAVVSKPMCIEKVVADKLKDRLT
jgi:predicted nucleic acid binding AN1-type Zn finger protein